MRPSFGAIVLPLIGCSWWKLKAYPLINSRSEKIQLILFIINISVIAFYGQNSKVYGQICTFYKI